jgi:putative addiction module antidote
MRLTMIEAKIRKVGNSAVMTLSTEMLALLDVKEGDTLYAVRTDDGGLKLMTENPDLLAALEAAEIVMDENRDLLQALA